MIEADTQRTVIASWLTNDGTPSELADLSDLGAVHLVVLQMLAERIQRAHAAGFSKQDIHIALSDEVVVDRLNQNRDKR